MSRKDYVKFAEVLRMSLNRAKSLKEKRLVIDLIYDLCTVFLSDNHNFNSNRFRKACGIE